MQGKDYTHFKVKRSSLLRLAKKSFDNIVGRPSRRIVLNRSTPIHKNFIFQISVKFCSFQPHCLSNKTFYDRNQCCSFVSHHFVTISHFHPGIIFEGKAIGWCPVRCSTLVGPCFILPPNIRLGVRNELQTYKVLLHRHNYTISY